MSPENHRELSHTADRGTRGVVLVSTSARVVSGGRVEFKNGGLIEKLPSCAEICCRTAKEGSGVTGWSRRYDCTLNAVKIAENKPAYPNHFSHTAKDR